MAGQHKPLLRSFAGGEIAPELYARLDLDKMQTGLAKALNFVVLPHGPAQNRAGFGYVLQSANSTGTRLIPFSYSVDQTMVLEFTEQKIRFHTNGSTLLESAQALGGMTSANPGVFTIAGHGYSNGDWVYCTAISSTFFLYGRYLIVQNATANTFTLTDLAGNAIDTTGIPAPAFVVNFARVYTVASPYGAGVLFDLHYTQSADVLTIVHPNFEPRELRRLGATNWQLSTIAFEPAVTTPAIPTGTADTSGGAGTPVDHDYVTTAVAQETYEESLASPALTLSNDLSVSGNRNEITPATVSGAVRYNIYKSTAGTGGLFGFIGQSDGTMFADDNIIPDLSQTPPEANDPFAGAGDYPSTTTYMEQRRSFAATDNKPQNTWMTRSATESNMTQSVPVRDNDAIIFAIKANQNNRIRHLVPLGDLVALTAGAEFRVYAANSDVLTPASVTPKAQSYVGANNVQPMVAENSVLYVQAQGGHVREFAYAGDGINGALYKSNDISILAPHLFDWYDITDLAFSRTARCPILWAVRDDGQLLGMTYVPGQNVRAWHQHDTAGAFRSVCCVTEGSEDVLYAAIDRTINGADVTYIERLHTRRFEDIEDAFFVDSGLTYDGPATTTISGLWHLIGETVSVLADGCVHPPLVVSAAGTITLLQAASKVHVGLQITSNLRTLPLSWQAEGFGQGTVKNVSKAHLRMIDSSGVKVGPADGRLVEIKQRTTEPMGSPPEPINGWRDLNIAPQWQDDGAVEVEQTNPLPVMVTAMVLEVVSGG